MRRVSKKRQALNSQVVHWREQFRESVGRCEKCLTPCSPENLDVHELVPGYVRAKSLDKRYAVMAVHRHCHTELEAMTIPHQMAYMIRARSKDFDLGAYWKLIGRRWPDMEHILYFLEKLK
jgi:hypothetical protein